MSIYPQLPTGSVCQFPFGKTLQYRTIVNLAEDGSRTVLQDPNAAAVQWQLNYAGLTDTELATLQGFLESMSGRLQTFTFLDPSGNLLVWSEDFSQPAWQRNTLLQIAPGVSDPLGTQRATTVTNTGSGSLSLVQTVQVPGSYLCCFSFFARSAAAVNLSLTRGAVSQSFSPSNSWRQFSLAITTSDGNPTSNFGVMLPAGAQIDLFGLQVEAQPAPSLYVQTLDQGGVYPATRFQSDSIPFTADAPNSNSCKLSLYSRITL
jgi:hypothetical protein